MTVARISIVTAALTLIALGALHVLSPEFDPSWRVVSEYADGRYGSVLSLMFLFWAISSWTLAFAIRPYASSVAGRIGLWLLIVAGAGTAMAAFFDINHPLHGLAGLLGVGAFPIAALLLSYALPRERNNVVVVWAAHATWITVAMLVGGLITLFLTYLHSGGVIPSDGRPLPLGTVLPRGTVAFVGYANRLLIVAYCLWNVAAASRITREHKNGGAVGVPPPESKQPDRRVLQAQLRICLDRADAPKRGLPFAADSCSRTTVESVVRASPSL